MVVREGVKHESPCSAKAHISTPVAVFLNRKGVMGMQTRLGQLSVKHSARGIPTYSLELWHDGLKKHRLIRGESESVVKRKATLQIEEWEERWAAVDAKERVRSQKTAGKRQQDESKELAAERSADAQQELDGLSSLLKATLTVDDTIDWESLKK
jgi:restriction system protein